MVSQKRNLKRKAPSIEVNENLIIGNLNGQNNPFKEITKDKQKEKKPFKNFENKSSPI